MNAEVPDDTSLIGRVIQGRFRIIDRIASGGMGAVYLAEQLPLGRKVALKVLEPAADNYSSKAQFQERFLLEAAAVAKLSHPNTIVLFDYGRTEDGRFFYAMELVEGVTLNKLIRDRRFVDPALAVHISAQICGSLREAHEAGLVHRDLKPGNIMLTRRGDDPQFVKVLDFGLVKVVGSDSQHELTRSGIVMGSPRYMAPEQVETRGVDHRADIYAFGTVLYHMLAGQPPFVYPGQFETLRAQVDEPPPPLEKTNPFCDAGPELRALLFQCLEKRPEARPQSMAEVSARLKACATEIGISIPSLSGVDISLLAGWGRAPRRSTAPSIEERVSSPPTMAERPAARAAQEAPALATSPVPERPLARVAGRRGGRHRGHGPRRRGGGVPRAVRGARAGGRPRAPAPRSPRPRRPPLPLRRPRPRAHPSRRPRPPPRPSSSRASRPARACGAERRTSETRRSCCRSRRRAVGAQRLARRLRDPHRDRPRGPAARARAA
ncbi:MAG: serine/threonine protein kinase [Sandaracinaceae bacterium]|nr:serine/threonine protein kinase [Sandaracinaceae bacterium]